MAIINIGHVVGPQGPAGTDGALNALPLTGGTLTGDLDVAGDIDLADNGKLKLGNSDDLQIYHSGTHSYISDGGQGNLYLQGSQYVNIRGVNGSNMFLASQGSYVKLYHNNVERLKTLSTGVNITGQVNATSFVGDGSGLTGLNVESEGMVMHSNTINNNMTIPTGKNAVSGGPIEIGTTTEITISQGSTWTIV